MVSGDSQQASKKTGPVWSRVRVQVWGQNLVVWDKRRGCLTAALLLQLPPTQPTASFLLKHVFNKYLEIIAQPNRALWEAHRLWREGGSENTIRGERTGAYYLPVALSL